MVIDNVFGLNSADATRRRRLSNVCLALSRVVHAARRASWCGMHGHLILLHFEPNKLSLQCGLCGYESEGWEVGRPMTSPAVRPTTVTRVRAPTDAAVTLRPLPSMRASRRPSGT